MNYEALFATAGDRVVRCGLVGVGDFGASLLAKVQTIPNLEIVLLCDRSAANMQAAIEGAGVAEASITCVESLEDASDTAFDILVEATGNPAAAAANAELAIARGQHVVMVSKEAGILVGPVLSHMAREKGLVYTEVEGDQPSLLMGLISWAKLLGLDVRAAGKSSEYDFVLEPGDTLNWRGKRFPECGLQDLWIADQGNWQALVEQRHRAVLAAGVPTRTVPDYCEMGVVANATGLMPDKPGLHAAVLRPTELADALQSEAGGGLFAGTGRIDVFNCLRRPDEASFAGGVFIIVACEDEKTWGLLKEKGHVVAANGKTAMLYNPQHLLGIEAPLTILSAVLLGMPTGCVAPKPVVDLVARTSRDFKKGERLTITDAHHHEVDGLEPELIPAIQLSDETPCPYYLAVEQVLACDVPAGSVVTAGMLSIDKDSSLWRLRCRQDELFS